MLPFNTLALYPGVTYQILWTEAKLDEHGTTEQFGLYFDGRKDKSLSMENALREAELEEHISLIKVLGFEYLGHFSLQSENILILREEIKNFRTTKNLDTSRLVAIGFDGILFTQVTKEVPYNF